MKFAYGKLGRSIPLTLDAASNVGGDAEVVRLLHILLDRGHTVHLIGRNRCDFEHPKLVNHWAPGGIFDGAPEASRHKDEKFETYHNFFVERAKLLPNDFDAWLVWLGQHGSSLHPVPAVMNSKKGTFTNPLVSDLNYGYPIVAIVNQLGIRPFWLCPDPRNMIKFRDLWNTNQRDICAQFNWVKDNTFYDEPNDKLREGKTRYVYSGIELLAAPPDDGRRTFTEAPPERLFGLLVNEGYSNLGTRNRLHIIQQWTKGLGEYEIFGTWCEASQRTLNRVITPVKLEDVNRTLGRWRATMTFPATGSGWATTKPWECFKAGVICFKHPDYDSQGHIYSSKFMPEDLYTFLRPSTMSGFNDRLTQLQDDENWRKFACLQYEYFHASHQRLEGGAKMVLEACAANGSK